MQLWFRNNPATFGGKLLVCRPIADAMPWAAASNSTVDGATRKLLPPVILRGSATNIVFCLVGFLPI
jgi:hypothetical protein